MAGTDAANMPRHEHAFVTGPFSASDPPSRSFKRAVTAWFQGDIVAGIGQFWATPGDLDPLTGITMEPVAEGPYRVFTWDGQAADPDMTLDAPDWEDTYSIVTSQTCDISPAGARRAPPHGSGVPAGTL